MGFKVVGEILFPSSDGKLNNPLHGGYGFYKDMSGVMWLVIGKAAIVDASCDLDGVVFARVVGQDGDYLPYTAKIFNDSDNYEVEVQ